METYTKTVEFERPDMPSDVQSGASCVTHAWAKVPPVLSREERGDLKARTKRPLKEREAMLAVHYYVDADLQDLTEEIGGYVSDSLEMACSDRDHSAKTSIVAGVCFMGEIVKILSPEKTVLMPDLNVICLPDLGCPPDGFAAFCDAHPDRIAVVYANTSVAVKMRVDWMVTPSTGLRIVQHLHAQGKKILWAPDRHLGSYIQKQTGADMLTWRGSCLVHDEFKGVEPDLLRTEHPNAKIPVHPGPSESVAAQADAVGLTLQFIAVAQPLSVQELIVATDSGTLHKMHIAASGKRFIEAPTAGNAATYKGCAYCPQMAMSALTNLTEVLGIGRNEIHIDPAIGRQAVICIDRMLDSTTCEKAAVRPQGDLAANTQLFQGIGPA